jgi:hypothetical protein
VCTVTLVPHDGGIRLMCNRDERRDRPPALAPGRERLGDRAAVFPRDPQGGGSWIGVNDAGLVVSVLNWPVRPQHEDTTGFVSRGLLVPYLLQHARLDALVGSLAAFDSKPYRPFRVVAAQRGRVVVAAGRGARVAVRPLDGSRPLIVTSSSIHSDRASAARRALFRRSVLLANGSRFEAQRAFHDHRWTSAPEISVVMSRQESRTVSRTSVDVGSQRICLTYEPLDADPFFDPCHVCL